MIYNVVKFNDLLYPLSVLKFLFWKSNYLAAQFYSLQIASFSLFNQLHFFGLYKKQRQWTNYFNPTTRCPNGYSKSSIKYLVHPVPFITHNSWLTQCDSSAYVLWHKTIIISPYHRTQFSTYFSILNVLQFEKLFHSCNYGYNKMYLKAWEKRAVRL